MSTWHSPDPPKVVPIGPAGWRRIALKAALLTLVISGGLALLLVIRLIEHPLCAPRRPVTPQITRAVCRISLRLIGITRLQRGQPMPGAGALLANHAGWLDILALNAATTLYFVAKAEVAGWPGIGWLARATGTLFITRKTGLAQAQAAEVELRLRAGHRLLFFPEGTSSDALRVLPFKSTLFAAFFTPDLRPLLQIQPVTVVYHAPPDHDPRLYGWWGDMAFAPHLLQVLATSPQGGVEVIFHPPVEVSDFPDRKALAAYCEAVIRHAHVAARG